MLQLHLRDSGDNFVERGELESFVVVEVMEDFLETSFFGIFEFVVKDFVSDYVDDGSDVLY